LAAQGSSYAAQAVPFPVRRERSLEFGAPNIPFESLSINFRDKVRTVAEKPTLAAPGPAESFGCQPEMYDWLLNHPDVAVRLWRVLGAKVAPVTDEGNGWFSWRDGHGSEVRWTTALDANRIRIWFAEGRVKPGLLIPSVGMKAVVLLDHRSIVGEKNRPGVGHQAHLYLASDNRAIALGARILGASAPRLAEQFLAQLEMFFGALAWYLDQDADRAARLFKEIGQPLPPACNPQVSRQEK
jgi:hypothetical protein